MTELSLRDAAQADVAAITTIYAHAVETGVASFEEVAPSAEAMAERMAAVAAKALPWIVAEEGGVVVGYAYASPFKPRSAYRFSLENSVYVAPDAQGRGIGQALLEALIHRCAALGYRQMIAGVGGAAPASIKLHERCGFRVIGTYEAVGFKFGRWLDVVMMQRPLG